jgi:hypothetical protein
MLVAKKIMPSFQEYLTLSEEIHASFPFKIFYTLWYGSWPKDLDKDYFKSTGQEVKKDEHEGQKEEHVAMGGVHRGKTKQQPMIHHQN